MTDWSIRLGKPGEEAALRRVWQAGFDDTDEYIERFYERFARPGWCVLAEADGKPVSAIYLLEGPVLCPDGSHRLRSVYTFALATLCEYRGLGIGAAVYQASCERALDCGADVLCVLPSEPGLYPFYEGIVPCRTVSSRRRARFEAHTLRTDSPELCVPVDAKAYARRREELLAGKPHGIMTDDFIRWETTHASFFGGGLFRLENGLAAAEMEDGVCAVKELLVPDGDEKRALAALAAVCPAPAYTVNTPAFFGGEGTPERYLLGTVRHEPDFSWPDDLWWGFAFD